ncbi:MAG: hypothetical protein II393_00235 [Cytophagales bacterium]|nr:hypothetical protein [Cytophagales bacterium]
MNNPQYVKVDDKLYKINTDFRIALECNNIAEDKTIGEYERALAIIYKLFGEDGLDCESQNKLLELGMKYLLLGNDKKELKNENKEKYELDFNKCIGLIKASFKFDYKYDPYELEYLHWYDFYNDLESLSTSEFGNCCILNRVTSILNQEPKEIKDNKQRQKLIEAQKLLQQKYCKQKEVDMTKEQEESAKAFYKSLGIEI